MNSDAFTKREAAQESVYIHEKEMEKYVSSLASGAQSGIAAGGDIANAETRLHALKKKLGEQRSHLDELEKHVYVVFAIFWCHLECHLLVPWIIKLTISSDQLTKSKGQQ